MYNDKFILCSRFAISSSSSLSPVANVRTIRSVSVCECECVLHFFFVTVTACLCLGFSSILCV